MSMPMPRRVMVTGGTGTLGRLVVRELVDAGHQVSVLSRHAGGARLPAGVSGVPLDLRQGVGLDAALAGVESVVHCATTLRGGDVDAAGNLVEAIRRHGGAAHLVYVSIVGVDRVPLGYYRAKLEVERLIEESDVPWTTLRATQFHDLLARVLGWLSAVPPVMPVPAGFSFQPVDAREVAGRLAGLAVAEPAGRVEDLGGPAVRDVSDLARSYLRASGRRRVIRTVPAPGKVARGYRDGGHLAPEHAAGQVTFEEYLARRFPGSPLTAVHP